MIRSTREWILKIVSPIKVFCINNLKIVLTLWFYTHYVNRNTQYYLELTSNSSTALAGLKMILNLLFDPSRMWMIPEDVILVPERNSVILDFANKYIDWTGEHKSNWINKEFIGIDFQLLQNNKLQSVLIVQAPDCFALLNNSSITAHITVCCWLFPEK